MQKSQPPPPGFAPPPPYTAAHQPPPQATIIINTAQYGPEPQVAICPYCRANITTYVEAGPSMKTHLFALLCCFIPIFWPCAPCVYCTDSCLVKKHYCPNCRKYLGMYDS